MACRKNAYRGLMEMSEYLEKQNEEAARQRRAFEEEQRKIWTPPSLLERCCLEWLAHGTHQPTRIVNGLPSAVSHGCSGCLKEHPKISLDFRAGAATASVSHALHPFVRFFAELPGAIETRPLNYRMEGLLSDHCERIKREFGAHLVSVEPKALASSRRACENQLERDEMSRAAKRRKVLGEAAPEDLLESVLEICYDHSLCDHLDAVDIAWMRTGCKSMGRVAAWMARNRMGSIDFSYTPLIPTREEDSPEGVGADPPPRRPLSPDETALATLRPREPQRPIGWNHSLGDPSDVQIRIHIEGWRSAIPERAVLFDERTKILEVARYTIDLRRFSEEGVYTEKSRAHLNQGGEGSLEYRVTLCTRDESFSGKATSQGHIILQSIAFTFNDFLGVYARMRLRKVKREYNSSQIKKPADKAYIKALARIVREAPGNADSFQGMEGWDNV